MFLLSGRTRKIGQYSFAQDIVKMIRGPHLASISENRSFSACVKPGWPISCKKRRSVSMRLLIGAGTSLGAGVYVRGSIKYRNWPFLHVRCLSTTSDQAPSSTVMRTRRLDKITAYTATVQLRRYLVNSALGHLVRSQQVRREREGKTQRHSKDTTQSQTLERDINPLRVARAHT